MSKMQAKIWDRTTSPEVQEELVKSMAMLECLLPTDWNTQCRHMLTCKFVEQLDEWGSFWATNMLVIEVYHTLVKSLGRSRKNLLISFANNYHLFDTSATQWRFIEDEIAHKAVPSNLSLCQPTDYNDVTVSLLPRQAVTDIALGDNTYMLMLKLYIQFREEFESLFDKYKEYIEDTSNEFVHLDKWDPPVGLLTRDEVRFQRGVLPMGRQAKVPVPYPYIPYPYHTITIP